MNIGEEICGEWLRHIKGCEFIQYNLKTSDVQGEIDVIGLNMKNREVYACEVAVHLVTGLQYNKNSQPDNVKKLTAKLKRDVDYVRQNFPDYKHIFMLWSPVVRNQKIGSKYNQISDVNNIAVNLLSERKAAIEMIINKKFHTALQELRVVASAITKELDSSVMRFLQVEVRLAKHLKSAGMISDVTSPSPSPAA
jgi:Holliday junction resolvase-like predicted endonuclease